MAQDMTAEPALLEDEDEQLVLEQRDAVEVYETRSGHIGIRQHDTLTDEDSVILVHPDDVDRFKSFIDTIAERVRERRASPDFKTFHVST
jgi:hypothetical protein